MIPETRRTLSGRRVEVEDPPQVVLDMLLALNRVNPNTYAGTVPWAEKARRRSRSRIAKESRKRNR